MNMGAVADSFLEVAAKVQVQTLSPYKLQDDICQEDDSNARLSEDAKGWSRLPGGIVRNMQNNEAAGEIQMCTLGDATWSIKPLS